LLGGIGVVTAVIGLAEMFGEGSTALFSDKWGKRPFVLACAAVVTLMYFLLPSVSSSLPWVMAVLFVLFLSFEGAVVGGLSLYSELVPEARSIVLSIIFGGLNLGFALGSWLGTRVWGMAGLEATCYIAGLLTLIALGLFYWFVEEAGEVRSMKGSHSTIS
jgi:predicted MFS family arabinose efflux permease